MIPRIIHYCWLSNEPMPHQLERCIESWRVHNPLYQIRRWKLNDVLQWKNRYLQEAISAKAWAFASDYIRLKVLAEYGGIYLDTDMLVLKSLDSLLSYFCFLGRENEEWLGGSIIGAIPSHWFIQACLKRYEELAFDDDYPVLVPRLLTEVWLNTREKNSKEQVRIFPAEFFYPLPLAKKGQSYKSFITPSTIAVHLWDMGWYPVWNLFTGGYYCAGLRRWVAGVKTRQFSLLEIGRGIYHIIGLGYVRRFFHYAINRGLAWLVKKGIGVKFISSQLPAYRKREVVRLLNITPGTWREFRRFGLVFRMDIGEDNGLRTYLNQYNNDWGLLLEAVKYKAIVLDIGAHAGVYSMVMASSDKVDRVVAFEPNPDMKPILEWHIHNNNITRIDIQPVALYRENTSRLLVDRCTSNKGMAYLSDNTGQEGPMVTCMTLDSWIQSSGLSRLDGVKVDIEGAELDFLLGAQSVIQQFRPVMLIEINDKALRRNGHSAEELVDQLLKMNYKVYRAHTKKPLTGKEFLFHSFFDAICYPA